MSHRVLERFSDLYEGLLNFALEVLCLLTPEKQRDWT